MTSIAVALALAVGACGGAEDDTSAAASTGGGPGDSAISLVAYSTPQVVYDEIIPDFQRTPAGEGVQVKTSFGASGEQSRAVEGGLDADVVSFSVEPDMTRLVDAGLVSLGWKRSPHGGIVTTSVVAFIVRKGNPKDIRDWDDLLRPDVEVLTPNPFTSGAAKWNLLAAYGAASDAGRDPEAGLAYLRELIGERVKVQDKSGREALQSFTSGRGDVLLSYEYEATTAQKLGEDIEYVVPDDTIRIDITFATTEQAPAEAKAFADYVLSEPAQKRFADWGYRPVDESVLAAGKDRFPEPAGLFTIDDLGGWARVDEELFDPEGGSIARIEEDAGLSTSG